MKSLTTYFLSYFSESSFNTRSHSSSHNFEHIDSINSINSFTFKTWVIIPMNILNIIRTFWTFWASLFISLFTVLVYKSLIVSLLFLNPNQIASAGEAIAASNSETSSTTISSTGKAALPLVKTFVTTFTGPDKTIHLAIFFHNKEGHHTYWKNPGSAGIPFVFNFTLGNKPLNLPMLEWPTPTRYIKNKLEWAYCYRNTYGIFFPLSSSLLKEMQGKELTIHVEWLACKDLCIPGSKDIRGIIKNNHFYYLDHSKPDFTTSMSIIKNTFNNLPHSIDYHFSKAEIIKESDGKLFFVYQLEPPLVGQKCKNKVKGNLNNKYIQNAPLVKKDQAVLIPFPNQFFSFQVEKINVEPQSNIITGKFPLSFSPEEDNSSSGALKQLPSNGIFPSPIEFKFIMINHWGGPTGIISTSIAKINSLPAGAANGTNSNTDSKNAVLSSAGSSSAEFSSSGSSSSVVLSSTEQKPISLAPAENYSSNSTHTLTFSSLIIHLLLALLGGLLLNFMPCVLPVVSLKLMVIMDLPPVASAGGPALNGGPSEKAISPEEHLGNYRHYRKEIWFRNLLYTAGILVTFLLLGIMVIILKKSGEVVGWGQHMQSPTFIILTTVALFIFALNLFGLFEFQVPASSFIGRLNPQGRFSEFSNGVLATILATPCSAPFLGTAMAYAFWAPPLITVLFFLAVGIGLASPFILSAPFPKLYNLMPRPGKWMVTLKSVFGIILLLTLLWPYHILFSLTNSFSLLIKLNVLLIMIFTFFYFQKNMTAKLKPLLLIPSICLLGLVLYASRQQASLDESLGTDLVSSTSKDSLRMNPDVQLGKNSTSEKKWSLFLMEEYRLQKKPLFIYFTADWCLTCKTNETLVLDSKEFKDLLQKNGVQILKGDWTKRDPLIGKWLEAHELVGVPAYFIQTAEGKLIKLGELITVEMVRQALKKSWQ